MKKKWTRELFLLIGFFLMGSSSAWSISADDFMPPASAETPEAKQAAETIQNPHEVKTEQGFGDKKVVTASTAQDAINTAVKNLEVGGGCEEVKFPSGFGFVSTGTAVYDVYPNPTATLIAQRRAYQIALLNAKKEMASYLNEMTTSSKEQMQSEMKTISSETDTLTNASAGTIENIEELVKGILRGYVVYNIADEQEERNGNVRVTIVATPKTMGKGSRVDPNSLTAVNIKDGLNTVLNELSTGLLSPVGGKVISVPQTQELAFVGFGSAIVPHNTDKATQAKYRVEAQKIAQMRARSALCGIILGEEIEGTSKFDTNTQEMNKQFEEAQKEDPAGIDKEAISKIDSQRKAFTSGAMSTHQISSLRKGILPRGVNIRTFMNPEKTIVEAVAVYLPSTSARANDMANEMKNSKIVQEYGDMRSNSSDVMTNQAEEGTLPHQGPTGQVTKDADL